MSSAPLSPLGRGAALFDLLLAMGLTVTGGLVAVFVAGRLSENPGGALAPVLMIQAGVVLLGLQWLLWRRGEGWRSLGLGLPALRDLWRGLLALALVFIANLVLSGLILGLAPEVLHAHQRELTGVTTWLVGDMSWFGILAVTVVIGFYEEVLARGFLLNRCRVLLSGVLLPVLLSATLFGLGHLYQGWYGVLQTTLIGVVFASLMVRWGSLWPLILAHTALNFLSLSVFRLLAVD